MCVYGLKTVQRCAIKNRRVCGPTAGFDGIIYEAWDHQRRTWGIALSFPADHLSRWRGNDIKLVLISHLVESHMLGLPTFIFSDKWMLEMEPLSLALMGFLMGQNTGWIQTCPSHMTTSWSFPSAFQDFKLSCFSSFYSGAGSLPDQPLPAWWQLLDGGGGL